MFGEGIVKLASSRSGGWRWWLMHIVGGSFVLAGLVNFLGLGEDVAAIFRTMAAANAGTRMASMSAWIAAHAQLMRSLAAVLMIVTGVTQLLRLSLWRVAAVIQLVMMLAFVTLLQRSFPEVFFADGLYAIALTAMLVSPSAARAGEP